MSKNSNLQSWYQCGNKTFFNIWQSFDETIKTNNFTSWHIDPELPNILKNIKRPKNNTFNYIQNLIVKLLKTLRKKYNILRLGLGGGIDSITILKLAIENDIYIDETVACLVSIVGDKKSDIEFLPNLNFAKKYEGKSIGKITTISPTIQDYDYLNDPNWFKNENILKGQYVPWRPCSPNQWIPRAQTDMSDGITILGIDKPLIEFKNKQPYWTTVDRDIDEVMGIDNVYCLFLDKNNPELVACHTYAYLDSIKQIPENGYVNWETFNNKEKISLIPKLGLYSTGHYFNDVALLGKTKFSWNYKTRRSKRELLKLGRNDIWNKIEATFEYIRKSYQNYPHLIESDGKLTKSIGRKGPSIKILPNKFEHLVLPG